MMKKLKILIILSLVVLALIFYLILTSASVEKPGDSVANQAARNKAVALSDENYRAQVKEIFSSYEKLSQDNNFTADKAADLKNKLVDLKGLPAKFKELHLKLVLALDQMEDYLRQNGQRQNNFSQRIINQLKADYGWLNN